MTGSQRDSPAQKPGDLKAKSAIFFILIGVVVTGLCFPLLYYSIVINYIISQSNSTGLVQFHDLWMMVVGGLIYQVFRIIVVIGTRPLHDSLCKEQTDLVKRERYIERSCEGTAKTCFHTFSFIWGWYVLRDIGWLPWCLGGSGALDELLTKNV
jgi:hypothetical protein